MAAVPTGTAYTRDFAVSVPVRGVTLPPTPVRSQVTVVETDVGLAPRVTVAFRVVFVPAAALVAVPLAVGAADATTCRLMLKFPVRLWSSVTTQGIE